jgi:hypothetical protein
VASAFSSLFNFCETTYLLAKIYRHLSFSKKINIQLRIPVFVRFAFGSVVIVVLEWIGILVYLSDSYYLQLYALEIVHLRVVIIVYVFLQLRFITFATDKVFTKAKFQADNRMQAIELAGPPLPTTELAGSAVSTTELVATMKLA